MGRGGPNVGKRPDKIIREGASLPQEPIGTADTATGTVKWWDSARGYGAIATDKTSPWDIWCHFSQIIATGYLELTPGERVEVEYTRADQDTFKYVARVVRRLSSPAQLEGAG